MGVSLRDGVVAGGAHGGGGPGAAPARGRAARHAPVRARGPLRPARVRRPLVLRHLVARVERGARRGARGAGRALGPRGAARRLALLHLRRRGARTPHQRALALPLRDGDVGARVSVAEVAVAARGQLPAAAGGAAPAHALRPRARPLLAPLLHHAPRPACKPSQRDLQALILPHSPRRPLLLLRAGWREGLHGKPR